jgi:aminoglycoside/choline kinase family phosphotransferase
MADVDMSPLAALCARYRPGARPTWTAMPGGASTRRYFRVELGDRDRAIGMFVPEGAKPEEIQKDAAPERWPFLEVRDLLASRAIRVPDVYADDTERGWLLIEDLGDDTLAAYLQGHPGQKDTLYARAVGDLARAQAALDDAIPGSVVGARRFDFDLLRWEIEHFREWGLDARGRPLAADDRACFDAIADRLAARIADLPSGFTHRDYQSRNLMVKDGALAWIDFQDALVGPRVYDLVALLNDSYQTFDRTFVEARLREFAAARGAGLGELAEEFDLVTVQRKLKDAGRFVFIDRKKGNPSFLPFVTPTIHKVRGSVRRLAAGTTAEAGDMRALDGILARTLGDEYAA